MIDAHYQDLEDDYKQSGRYKFMDDSLEPRKLVKPIRLDLLEDTKTRRSCVSCQEIVNNLIQDTERLTQASAHVRIFSELLIMQIEYPLQQSKPPLRLVPVETPSPAYATARTCDPQQADIALLRKWIDRCQTSHGNECLSSTIPPPSHKIYLIDTEVCCLVHKSADCRYIALSYVWGQITRSHTTKSNLLALQTPGSITTEAEQLTIPKTIRDALRLVSLLGERYLWVDSFCIIQDEEDTKELQLASMASIYANAYFTIAAAEGKDADHGIPGFCGSAEAREIDQVRFHLSSGRELIAHDSDTMFPRRLRDTTWNMRGWTFQEGLFSRRILLFNGSVSWYCRSTVWEEPIRDPTEDMAGTIELRSAYAYKDLAFREPQWPDLEQWASLVRQYNGRKLTFDGDVINAFSGAAAIFQRQFNGGLLWGIPEMFFDHCIIWMPGRTLRRRRLDSDSSSASKLPSWSWVAWEGAISLQGYSVSLNQSPYNDPGHGEIQPMVEWYKSKTSSALASIRFPVKNTFHSIVSAHRDKEQEACPDGWTKTTTPQGNSYYTNDLVPSIKFRLPIPLFNHDIASMPDNESRFLFFKAQHVWFLVEQDVRTPDWPGRYVKLCDPLGNWAGSFIPHTPTSDPFSTGESCELLALSLATVDTASATYYRLDTALLPPSKDLKVYKFYYVMWIEREDGIAYRKAIGMVDKDIWDQQNPTTIDVVLG